ncbi:TonB family protein [Salinisphaera sp.]|uniref:energy transducer TonB n=1 Tax=Salinisphaera sp. TaxID=1914330 RepID=UPI002D773E0C|nr:TonB family protein [Salinisphaera sp.]HET7314947.1 TonB family protein [Salinisphaera sp.]
MRITKRQWLIAVGWAALLHLLVIGLLAGMPAPPAVSPPASRGVTVSLDDFDSTPPAPPSFEDMPIEQLSDVSGRAATAATGLPSAPPAADSEAAGPAPIESAKPVGPLIGDASSPQIASASTPDAAPPEAEAKIPIESAPTAASKAHPSGADSAPAIAAALPVTPDRTLSDQLPEQQVTARAIGPAPDASPEGAYGDRDQATDQYVAQLRAWLARHKHYPEKARREHVEGTVKLFLAVDAHGEVLEARILDASGSPMLTAATRHMLAASKPLPAMPAAAQRDRLELIIPVVFSLR